MHELLVVVFVVLSYLMGSLPVGYWIGRRAIGPWFDIRNFGSSSVGFTNVLRVLDWKAALPVLLLDVAKGYVPVIIGKSIGSPSLGWACLIAVMIGHAKSLFFFIKEKRFSGGKSVASALGGILALQPHIALLSLGLFAIVLLAVRIMSIASMAGSICAFVLTLCFHLGLGWNVLFGIVVLLILYTHRRNIGRLVHGTEPKLFEWSKVRWPWQKKPATTTPEIVCAFVVHAMGWSDLMQTILAMWIGLLGRWKPTRPFATWILANMPVIENAEIRGIRLKDGRRVRVLISAILFMPTMIKEARLANDVDKGKVKMEEGPEYDELRKQYIRSKWFRDRLWKRLQSAAVLARRRGATVLGLGALLSSEFGGGNDLQEWCNEIGLGLTIDNGAAYTAVATVQAVVRESKIPLSEAIISVVGASGFIGRITTWYLAMLARKVTAIGRDKANMHDFAKGTEISTALSQAYESDIVVLLTSSPNYVVTLKDSTKYKRGAVFMDAARPPDFDPEILKQHPELEFTLVCCGVIQLPGDEILCGMDFHFDGYFPACLAQTIMVAAGGEEGSANATRGAYVTPARFEYFAEMAGRYGFEVVTSQTPEGEVFEGKYN